jgi:hypothetical protein
MKGKEEEKTMGVLEIALTIAAWQRGWRALALIPGMVAFLIGVLIGAATRASGSPTHGVTPLTFAGDLLCVVVLALMAVRGRLASATTAVGPVATSVEIERRNAA